MESVVVPKAIANVITCLNNNRLMCGQRSTEAEAALTQFLTLYAESVAVSAKTHRFDFSVMAFVPLPDEEASKV